MLAEIGPGAAAPLARSPAIPSCKLLHEHVRLLWSVTWMSLSLERHWQGGSLLPASSLPFVLCYRVQHVAEACVGPATAMNVTAMHVCAQWSYP